MYTPLHHSGQTKLVFKSPLGAYKALYDLASLASESGNQSAYSLSVNFDLGDNPTTPPPTNLLATPYEKFSLIFFSPDERFMCAISGTLDELGITKSHATMFSQIEPDIDFTSDSCSAS